MLKDSPPHHPSTRVQTLQGSNGEWTSMGVEADGSYGLGSGFFYSVPVTCSGGGPVLRVGGIPITTELASAMEAQRVALSK